MFINITCNVCTLALGNRIGSAARRQPSRSSVRHRRLRRQNSSSEESDSSDIENSGNGESFDHLCLNVGVEEGTY
jgi:ribose 1,5-bisphosphokinase PhnN